MSFQIAKLVFAGPVGAGKSTAIKALSDGPPVSTEMPMSEGMQGNKTTTTVALDFGTAMMDDGTPLFLYGLPGQDHFDFMRGIVLEGALGALVLLDGRDIQIGSQCVAWVDSIRGVEPGLPMVVGVTHADAASEFSMAGVRAAMRSRGLSVPVMTLDARDRAQVTHLVRAMLVAVE